MRFLFGKHRRLCPVCGHHSFFAAFGSPLRFDALCLRCGSLERHRQHFLLIQRRPDLIDGARVLHVAPEGCFKSAYSKRCLVYCAADISAQSACMSVDICNMTFETGSFDTFICHHVLEHVADEKKAVSEINRILTDGGTAIISVPMIHTWQETFQRTANGDLERDLYFGQFDHARYFGRDLVSTDVAVESYVSRYSLLRGKVIFIAKKRALSAGGLSGGEHHTHFSRPRNNENVLRR